MVEYLTLSKANCRYCYKCIRYCPVKAIGFSSGKANIVPEECVLCGQCFAACPHKAKIVRNDIKKVQALLSSGARVYASIAPSFAADQGAWSMQFLHRALKQLGFIDVQESSSGRDIVKKRYDAMLLSHERSVVISSDCHSINLLIRKYFPSLLPSLAEVVSPMQAHSIALKQADPDAKVVFIGACISQKAEAEEGPCMVDCALTFEEMAQWFQQEGIAPSPEECGEKKRDNIRIFTVPTDILCGSTAAHAGYDYLIIDGMKNCMNALKDLVDGNLDRCFMDMSACVGGCIAGPAMNRVNRSPIRNYASAAEFAGKPETTMPPEKTLTRSFGFAPVRKVQPGTEAIQNVLRAMGKTKPEYELNCGICGYDTCREKARAVLMGKAELTMCLPFLKEKSDTFSNHIIENTPNAILVLDEQLRIQQINAAACRLFYVDDEHDAMGKDVADFLDADFVRDVVESGRNAYEVKKHIPKYEKYVMTTVVHDRHYGILIVLMRDVTEGETGRLLRDEARAKTVDIADKVIARQMRTVQEIASLLGETAAETQVALSRLKAMLHNE